MTITEAEVRDAALRVLAAAPRGYMATEDLIPALRDALKPTGDDNLILEGRSDTRFSQKVRNLVSHREQSTSLESQGLAIYDEEREGWQITDAGRIHVASHDNHP